MYKYFHGLFMAICGKYPHKEVEHLEFIQENLTKDYNWFQGIPAGEAICQRHRLMASADYKTKEHLPIKTFRYNWFETHPVNERRKDTRYSRASHSHAIREDVFKEVP